MVLPLKRIVITADVTYPGEDPRTLEELVPVAVRGIQAGVQSEGGTMSYAFINSVGVDPVPDSEIPITPPPAPQPE